MKTLVIEDDHAIQELIAGVLEKRGYDFTICDDAESGQEEYKKEQPKLIILDLHLPGMNGVDFCNWLRGEKKDTDTFILISTANNSVETFHKVLKAGANDYIGKPLKPQLLNIRLDVAKHTIDQIEERKKYEQKILESEKRFRLISENSRDLVCSHDADGIIDYISPSCKNLLGYEPRELVGTTLKDIVSFAQTLPGEEDANPLDLGAGQEEKEGVLETTKTWRAKTKNGSNIWLKTYTEAQWGEDGSVKGFFTYSRESTDEKAEEEAIKILEGIRNQSNIKELLSEVVEEIQLRLGGSAAIHIQQAATRNKETINGSGSLEDHTSAAEETPNDQTIFQGTNAGSVFHYVDGLEQYEAIIAQPIAGAWGRPIGKITILSNSPIKDSERLKAILTLASAQIGVTLENQI